MTPEQRDELRFSAEAHLEFGGGGDELANGVLGLLDALASVEAAVQRVRALHEHRAPEPPYVEYCEHCGADWPCQTVRVLDA